MWSFDRFRKQKGQKESLSIVPFTFKSTCHQRYENGTPKMGPQKCLRTVTVEKNTNGCRGYKLEPGVGYIVKLFNDDLGKPNMSDKPMNVISKSDTKIELQGFPILAQSPFGWQEVDYRDYGLTVYYRDGEVEKCVLHMFDRNVDIEYSLTEKDEYIEMINQADFNPFNITCDRRLYSGQKMPDLRPVLRKELNDLYSKLLATPLYEKKQLILGYTFSLVESYYKNAGYVPKEDLDQIIGQVFDALQSTPMNSVFSTLDNFKYECYYAYLHP